MLGEDSSAKLTSSDWGEGGCENGGCLRYGESQCQVCKFLGHINTFKYEATGIKPNITLSPSIVIRLMWCNCCKTGSIRCGEHIINGLDTNGGIQEIKQLLAI